MTTTQEVIDAMLDNAESLENPKLKSAVEKARDALVDQTHYSFGQSVDPDENAWAPLQYRTPPPPPLILTGEMLAAVLQEIWGAEISDTEMSISGAEFTFYTGFQDEGTSRIPARPFLGFGQKAIDIAAEAGVEVMNENLMRAW